MKVVFNSSPLIFLARLNVIEKVLELFHYCYLPQAVVSEVSFKEDEAALYIKKLIDSSRLKVLEVKFGSLSNSLNRRLGKGESQTIALGIDVGVDYVILDDSVARKEALKLGLKVKGTLGLLRKLHIDDKVRIDDLERLYQELREIDFRVKRSIFDNVFAGLP